MFGMATWQKGKYGTGDSDREIRTEDLLPSLTISQNMKFQCNGYLHALPHDVALASMLFIYATRLDE